MTKEEKESLIVQMKLAKKTADELIAIYKAWGYKFKPEYSIFLHEVIVSSTKPSFVEYLREGWFHRCMLRWCFGVKYTKED